MMAEENTIYVKVAKNLEEERAREAAALHLERVAYDMALLINGTYKHHIHFRGKELKKRLDIDKAEFERRRGDMQRWGIWDDKYSSYFEGACEGKENALDGLRKLMEGEI